MNSLEKFEGIIDTLKESLEVSCLEVLRVFDGKSGDYVCLVEVIMRQPQYNGYAVLKLSKKHAVWKNEEYELHESAVLFNNGFSKKYIPEPICKVETDEDTAFLMKIAGGGVNATNVLYDLPAKRQGEACCTISKVILDGWHVKEELGERISLSGILNDWLGYRVSDESLLPALMEDVLSIKSDCESFFCFNKDYPNPYLFARGGIEEASEIEIRPALGAMHGDFHAGNCLCEVYRGEEQCYFIDFAQYREGAPLFFDHAYLEFSILINTHGDLSAKDWFDTLNAVENVESYSCYDGLNIPRGIDVTVKNIAKFREGLNGWVEEVYPDRKEDLYMQILMSRVAVGLNFANKYKLDDDEKKSNRMKEYAFLYAASSLNKFFEFNDISFSRAEVGLYRASEEVDASLSGIWRDCNSFNKSEAGYVLIAGKQLGGASSFEKENLVGLPWNVVFDFDSDENGSGVLKSAIDYLSERRELKVVLPGQNVKEFFSDSLCWFKTNGWVKAPETIIEKDQKWRRSILREVRELGARLKGAKSPLPINVVVLGGCEDYVRIKNSISALDEEIGDYMRVVIICENEQESRSFESILDLSEEVNVYVCALRSFLQGINQRYACVYDTDKVFLPARASSGKSRGFVEIDKRLYSASLSCLEIVHSQLSNAKIEEQAAEDDFYKGNKISWLEIERGLDVTRDVAGTIKSKIKGLLQSNRAERFKLVHLPGTGATTVLRRVAWEMKEQYPVIFVKNNSTSVTEYLEQYASATNLPILLVIDGGVTSSARKERIWSDITLRGLKCVLLEAERTTYSEDRESRLLASLPASMNKEESLRFLEVYKRKASMDRQSQLERLTNNQEFSSYRVPFFYGFFTFEEEFKSIDKFIEGVIGQVSSDLRKVVLYVSLVTQYSQEYVPIGVVNILLGREADAVFRVDKIFGRSDRSLLVVNKQGLRIVHPIIAIGVLKECLKLDGSDFVDQAWKRNLSSVCCDFIGDMAVDELLGSDSIEDILSQIFIERGGLKPKGSKTHNFSQLLQDIPSEASQHKVLKMLCDCFPDNAHYLSHFGRHINYNNVADSKEAITLFERAIALDPDNEIHYHGLAMVYRGLVYGELEVAKRDPEKSIESILGGIDALFILASQGFSEAYSKNKNSEHSLVSHIQLINRSVEGVYNLFKRSKAKGRVLSYSGFFKLDNKWSRWCVNKLDGAEWIVSELKEMEYLKNLSAVAERSINDNLGFYEEPIRIIEGLTSIIDKYKDEDHTITRRMLANAYFKHELLSDKPLVKKHLMRIVTLMEDNLKSDPSNERDIRIWFKAYRALPEFSLMQAIERVSAWATLTNSAQASYYLYILHYLNYMQGVPTSFAKCEEYIERCRRAFPISSANKKSHEWMAREKYDVTCTIINSSKLGKWDGFFERRDLLQRVTGTILSVESAKKGKININGLKAFFVPGNQFYSLHINKEVSFYLGFSYEGLRAWEVELVDV